jgi:hypothetical protein
VLLVETEQPPNPGATVTIGGQSVTTAVGDGSFTLTGVPANATTGTVSAAGELPLTLTLKLTAGQVNDLGTIFLSSAGYNASASGQIVNSQNQPVAGASVTIGGQTTTSAADGTFTINNLPVGLGGDPNTPIGLVHATGFVDKPIVTTIALGAGPNNLGPIPLGQPIGQIPGQPYDVFGFVKKNGQPVASAPVNLGPTAQGPLETHTDSTGAYFFWVPAGTYTVTDLNTNKSQQVTVQSTGTPVHVPDFTE